MTTDENILIEMLERVTNPSRDTVDNLAMQIFCMIIRNNNDLVTPAHELIVKKLYSSNTTEVERAVGLLQECMSNGGLEFQKKTAKFTFLNDLIALVLDKHSGTPVSVETKKLIMDCLMLWTAEYQDKPKIQEAYDNLKKQFHFAPHSSIPSPSLADLANNRDQRSSILGKDDDLVAKLLKEGGTENYKKANLLIQHRFNQEARRTETISHLKSEFKKIDSTTELLGDMLKSYNLDAPEADSREIIQELYNTCKNHNEKIATWPEFLDDEPEFLEDVLHTKDVLMAVIKQYKEMFKSEKRLSMPTISNASTTNTELLSDLLGDTLTSTGNDTNLIKPCKQTGESNTMHELNQIFGSIIDNVENNTPDHPSELLGNLDFLEPINVFETENYVAVTDEKEMKKGFKELREIDKLSEEMFKQSLKEEPRLLSFKKEPKKVALNEMAKHKINTLLIAPKEAEIKTKTPLRYQEECKSLEVLQTDLNDFSKDKVSEKNAELQEKELKLTKCSESNNNGPSLLMLKPLADISVNLDEVTPLDEGQRLIFDDEDIKVTLNFTADRPIDHVSVIVMSVTNKSKLPVKDFQFEASVKKPCKVRLLPPTDVAMAPRKPFRPSNPINQVILLLNPTQNPVDITCIIGYKLGDDPDPIKESIVTKDIPYV